MNSGRRIKLFFVTVFLLVFGIAQNAVPAKASSDFIVSNGVLTKYNGSTDRVTIPSGVTSIGDYAFSECTDMIEISIPKSVTSIGRYAFNQCSGLKSVTIPDSVAAVGNYAFYQCKSLKAVTLSANLKTIGIRSFSGCSSLTKISVPGSVTSIGNYAFEDCSSLKSVSILSNIKSFGIGIFAGCDNLTISGYKNTAIQTYADKNNISFKSLGLGSLTVDTQYYTLAPKNSYTIGVNLLGAGLTVKAYSSGNTVVGVTKVDSKAYKIAGLKTGMAYIMFDVYNGKQKVSHVSVKVIVKRGVTPHGSAKKQTADF